MLIFSSRPTTAKANYEAARGNMASLVNAESPEEMVRVGYGTAASKDWSII